MASKQGPENTEFVKDVTDTHDKYIFQKNTKTKTGAYIIIALLVLLILGIIVSAVFFRESGGMTLHLVQYII